MALGSTQPLTEMSTWNLPGGKGRPARGADNLTAICEQKMWEPRRLRSSRPVIGIALPFTFFYNMKQRNIVGKKKSCLNIKAGGKYSNHCFESYKYLMKISLAILKNLYRNVKKK
jgi:hypothetical protein